MDLFHRSIEIILANQHLSGAYIACPNFPPYRYCWFRDSSFIAYAMDLCGESKSAARFHEWAAAVILARSDRIQRAIKKFGQGAVLKPEDVLHTRYAPQGGDIDEEWPNFQLDGFGTWLWALSEHCRITEVEPPEDWLHAADEIAEYLQALWKMPCYDCWEEFPSQIHTYTLSAIYAGLEGHSRLCGKNHLETRIQIAQLLMSEAVRNGTFVKYLNSDEIDASLLALATPYRLLSPEDPLMRATASRIERELCVNGGVHRYRKDSYYGGGEWVLLTAWLGWYYAQIGEKGRAYELLHWVEAQADAGKNLPEQVSHSLNVPDLLNPWRERWGEIARPLLWSHAKYLILRYALKEKSSPLIAIEDRHHRAHRGRQCEK